MSGAPLRIFTAALCLMLCLLASSCGGSGDGGAPPATTSASAPPSGNNVATAIVDSGPVNNSANTLFVSVTVCVPGSTSNCQTIDHVEVDTASYGLRILSSVLTVALPVQTFSNGAALLECTNFVQGYSWGPVVAADVQIAGEAANSLPVQVIGDPTYSTVPADCSSLGTAVDTVSGFGANGILGVGPFVYDCPECSANTIPMTYYACMGSSNCVVTTVATAAQVQNPVASFAGDDNGVIVQLPSVGSGGADTVSGYLIFGVDTQSNNASNAGQTVLTVDDFDYLTVDFNGMSFPKSFIDSGSNGYYFNDSNLPTCTQNGLTDFYCPTSTVSLSATLTGANGVTAAADFSIANAESLFSSNSSSNSQLAAFSDLGGTFPSSTSSFDVGMPFYYGRRVATVINGSTTTVGTGPYFAF